METMTQNPTPSKIILNLLVLITVIGLVITGWLIGHTLRYSNPALWHPPIEEINPQIKTGFESEGIRRQAVLMGNPSLRALNREWTLILGEVLSGNCVGNTYYTSLPAKCRSADGSLVRVTGDGSTVIYIPPDK
jgi:hypothetical protein